MSDVLLRSSFFPMMQVQLLEFQDQSDAKQKTLVVELFDKLNFSILTNWIIFESISLILIVLDVVLDNPQKCCKS